MRVEARSRSLLLVPVVFAVAMAATFNAGRFAEPAAIDGPEGVETKTGFLIPSQCKSEEGVKPEPKGATDAWPAPHSTACALRPACIESGYGLWVEDRFYRFDEGGHEKALHYFQTTKRTSYNKTHVTGDFGNPEAVRVEEILLAD